MGAGPPYNHKHQYLVHICIEPDHIAWHHVNLAHSFDQYTEMRATERYDVHSFSFVI